ncbi:MAG TPA: cation transporter [Acidimicrobiia bacterium]|nr:cation transporter [Acidimicrobiia bacterium]
MDVTSGRRALIHRALVLGYITLAWNIAEAAISMAAALLAGSRALLGFGLDSVVESLSACVLVWRLHAERRDPGQAERVEQRALRFIGATFFVLAVFVGFEAIRSLVVRLEPESSPVGIGVTAVSLVVMPFLARAKHALGGHLNSRAVQADAAQTKACAYLSAVVLAGLVLNAALGWWWADPVAALAVVGFLVGEGVEALRAERVDDCC